MFQIFCIDLVADPGWIKTGRGQRQPLTPSFKKPLIFSTIAGLDKNMLPKFIKFVTTHYYTFHCKTYQSVAQPKKDN